MGIFNLNQSFSILSPLLFIIDEKIGVLRKEFQGLASRNDCSKEDPQDHSVALLALTLQQKPCLLEKVEETRSLLQDELPEERLGGSVGYVPDFTQVKIL